MGYYNTIVTYLARDLPSKEAQDSIRNLYVIIQGKLFGIDNVLNDILDDEPF